MKRIILLILCLAIVSTIIGQALSGDLVAIRQGANIEWFRSSTTIDAGAVYVWSDTRAGGRDLYAQLVTPSGEKMWGVGGDGLLLDGKPGRQEDPMIVTTSDGNVIVAWVDFAFDRDGDIYANKISPTGEKLWGQNGEGIIVCNAPRIQISINIVPDNLGGAYIAWSDYRASNSQIYIQHFNSTGVPTWVANGVNIDPELKNKLANTMWEDEDGCAVMAYVTQHGQPAETGVSYIKFDKSNPNAIAWGPLPIGTQTNPAVDPQFNPKMCPDGAGGFIFAWEYKDVGVDDLVVVRLKAQRIDASGVKQWDAAGVNVTGNNPLTGNQEKHRIVEVDEGGAIIAWEDRRGFSSQPNIYLQKLSLAGLPEWTSNGLPLYLESDNTQSDLRATKTNDNGVAIIWEDSRNTDVARKQVFAQRVLANGNFAWEQGGVLVCNETGGQFGGNIKQLGQNYAVVWADQRSGSVGLATQIFSSAGVPLLQANGIYVYFGLSGNSEEFILKTYGDTSYTLWLDTRYGTFGRKIFYQVINGAGEILQEEDGRRASYDDLSTTVYEESLVAEINDVGEVCVAWLRQDEGNALQSVYAQIINSTGDKLLPDIGYELKNNGNSNGTSPFIIWRNNGWEIYWNENGPDGSQVYGQRIVGTSLVWGENAKRVLADITDFGGRACTLINARADYLIFLRKGGDYVWVPYIETYNIIRLDADANPLAGWGDLGKELPVNRNFDESSVFVTNDKIAVFWTENDEVTDDIGLMLTLIDNAGEILFTPPVVNLTQSLTAVRDIHIYHDDLVFTATFSHKEIGETWKNRSIRFQVSNSGITHLWGNTGVSVLPSDASSVYPHNAAQTMQHNNRHITVWSMYPFEDDSEVTPDDIYMSILNSSGAYISNNPNGFVVINADKSQEIPQLSPNISNIITVAWKDGLSSGKEPIYGLYMQRVDVQAGSNIDITQPALKTLTSVANYPNPFNPETSITFNLQSAAIVKIDIFNIRGQLVRTITDRLFDKGNNVVVWNGLDNVNKPVGSGVYFYRISVGDEMLSKKMLLLK